MAKFLLIFFLIVLATGYFTFYGWDGEKSRFFSGDFSKKTGVQKIAEKANDVYYSSKARVQKELASIKYTKQEDRENGEVYFNDAEKSAENIISPETKAKVFLEIAQKRISADKEKMEEEILNSFEKAKQIIDFSEPENKDELLKILIEAEAPMENNLIILRSVSELDQQKKSPVLFDLATGYLKEKNLVMAQEMANQIEDEKYKSAFLIMMINSASEMEDLNSAREVASKIQEPIYRAYGFLKIIRSLIEKGKIREAQSVAENVQDELLKNIGLIDVANAYISENNFDAAYQILGTMK